MLIKIAALFTGSEILRGQTQNTNLTYLGEILTKHHYQLLEERTTPDQKKDIINHIQELIANHNILFICGGLGPTNDDITLDAVSKATNTPLTYSLKEAEKLKKKLTREMPPSYFKKQCLCLEGATIIENTTGLALGFELFLNKNKVIYILPGPPREFNPMLKEIIQRIQKKNTNDFFSKTSYIYGIPETIVEDKTKYDQKQYPKINFAYCANTHLVKLTLSGEKNQQKNIEQLYNKYFNEFKGYIFQNESINQILHQLLLKKKLTLSLAESCTGGLTAQMISQIPSCSQYFLGALVAYNNTIKQEKLTVKEKTLAQYGAVSKQTVKEMLIGCQKMFNSNISIAISGIAGQEKSENKPSGLVYIGISINQNRIIKKYNFSKSSRINIQKKASIEAIRLLINELEI